MFLTNIWNFEKYCFGFRLWKPVIIYLPYLALCELLYKIQHTFTNSMALILGIYHFYKVTYYYLTEKFRVQKSFVSVFDFEILSWKYHFYLISHYANFNAWFNILLSFRWYLYLVYVIFTRFLKTFFRKKISNSFILVFNFETLY